MGPARIHSIVVFTIVEGLIPAAIWRLSDGAVERFQLAVVAVFENVAFTAASDRDGATIITRGRWDLCATVAGASPCTGGRRAGVWRRRRRRRVFFAYVWRAFPSRGASVTGGRYHRMGFRMATQYQGCA